MGDFCIFVRIRPGVPRLTTACVLKHRETPRLGKLALSWALHGHHGCDVPAYAGHTQIDRRVLCTPPSEEVHGLVSATIIWCVRRRAAPNAQIAPNIET